MQICILSNEQAYPIVPPLAKQQNYIICLCISNKKVIFIQYNFSSIK